MKAPTLGILGGGQLAKMTAQAASRLGVETTIVERTADCPARAVATHCVVGDWNDPAVALRLAAEVDVVTLESEFVELAVLRAIEASGRALFPSARTLALIQDKFAQKQTVASAGLPVADSVAVDSPDDVRKAGAEFGWPLVLKRRRNAYDGKGNATVRDPAAWTALSGGPGQLYVERFVPFAGELAVIVARGRDGRESVYPVVESVQREHICHEVVAPAPIDPQVAAQALAHARAAVAALDGVGAFGVELFATAAGRVLVNELAPRVHNSGHYSIEACVCSQFENHVRAVFGWPLGDPRLVTRAACMINLLGAGPGSGEPQGLAAALAVSGANVHVYGKRQSQRGRKMGHLTVVGDDVAEVRGRARRAAAAIVFGAAGAT